MKFLSPLLFLALCCCKPLASVQKENQTTLRFVVESELGTAAIIEKNKSQAFALAYRDQNRETKYIVVRLSDLNVILKETITGSVRWSGEMQLKESLIPGMVRRDPKPDDNIRLIDLNNYIIHKK